MDQRIRGLPNPILGQSVGLSEACPDVLEHAFRHMGVMPAINMSFQCDWMNGRNFGTNPYLDHYGDISSLRWRHNGHDSVSNHQPRDCFLNRLFRHRSKKTSKLRVIGLCAGNSPEAGEFPAQIASNAENVSIWWRHHDHFVFRHDFGNISSNGYSPFAVANFTQFCSR